jgi:GNAT superfamily N-acetyltransferase
VDEEQRTRTYASIDFSTHQIIQCDGQDVGCMAVERHENHIQLVKLYLLPAFQGQGIGTFLIRQLIAEATETNKPMQLRVLAVNPARRLYEREGFMIQAETEERLYMEYVV